MAAVTVRNDFGAQENKTCHCFHSSPSSCHEAMGPDAMILVFWVLSFKPGFSLSSFTFIKRLVSPFSLSVIRTVSSAYLWLLIFLPEILIPACGSSSLAFHMMYSTYKLNRQDDNILPFAVPCLVLTVPSWPAYRFLRRQVMWSGTPISLRIFHNFVVIHTVKGFSIVNEAKVDVFLESSCFFDDPMDVGSSASLRHSLYTGICWFILCGSLAWRLWSITLPAGGMSATVW